MERKVTRMYTGTDGKSHFEDIAVPLREDGASRWRSEVRKATGIYFQEFGSDYVHEWHHADRRQFVISIEGEGEIELGDGIRRRFGPGDILLAEDRTGQGHISRVVSKQPRKVVVVTLD